MLTLDQVRQQRRRRSPPSLKQQYQEYVLQRIEGFKNSINREDLLKLGDEAVAELHAATEGQFLLTEVLMLDCVDRLITKRLALKSYRRWREQFIRLRKAQREPNHWGLDPGHIIEALLPRIEPGDHVLVLGGGAEGTAYLMAAHDAVVTFVAGDLGAVERVESRMTSEGLGSQFLAWVAQLGHWFPELEAPLCIAVIDAGILVDLDPPDRERLTNALQDQTEPGGIHLVLPGHPALAPEAVLPFYPEWEREALAQPKRRSRRSPGIALTKPLCQLDPLQNVSETHARRTSSS
ncbi:MAG: hypothetical protein ABI836_12380 [Gemmatimonadota bacterium]